MSPQMRIRRAKRKAGECREGRLHRWCFYRREWPLERGLAAGGDFKDAMADDGANSLPDLVVGGLGLVVGSKEAKRDRSPAAAEFSTGEFFSEDLVTKRVDFDAIVCGAQRGDDAVFDDGVSDDGFDAFHAQEFVCDDRDGIAL